MARAEFEMGVDVFTADDDKREVCGNDKNKITYKIVVLVYVQ
jgi:hypothetical protein